MGSFLRKWWRLLLSLVFIAAAVQLFVRPTTSLEDAGYVRTMGSGIFRPVYIGMNFVRQGFHGVWSNYIALVNVSRENMRLRDEVDHLREKLHEVRDAQIENRRLKDLLQYSTTLSRRSIGARVTGHDITPWFQAIFLDTGSEAGIEKGMSVATPQGAVGRVYSTRPGLTEVLLVSDSRFAADVMVERNRVRAIAEGIGENLCRLKYVSLTHDIVVGDRIVFTGFDGAMPKGMLLGIVVEVDQPKDSLYQKITVQSAVNFQNIEEVLVIMSPPTIPFRPGKD